jgi:iron-sulfur cluster assembly accessory protein
MISTDAALSYIDNILRKHPKGSFLRICVESGGCAGFQYRFSIDFEKNNQDVSIYPHIISDKESFNFLNGAKLDYICNLMEERLVIMQPSAQKTCGCGNSFDI